MWKSLAGAGVAVVLALCGEMVVFSEWSGRLEGFDAQVERLLRTVRTPQEQLDALARLLRDVERTLNTVWPDTKVKSFGSLSTGLGLSSSDADLSVMPPTPASRPALLDALAAFRAEPALYRRAATRGRLLSITLHYVPANIFCDINFEPQATLFESDLLRFLLNSDERALKLGILIKYWAKLHHLVRGKYLTSYGMMMLVVFYLQQRGLLPSVVELQAGAEPLVLNGTDRYNVAFDTSPIATDNEESLYRILGGFFEYYEHFDFEKYVVCPFTGRIEPRSVFEDVKALPDEFQWYKRNVADNITLPFNTTAVCIRSLFVHNDNSAWRVGDVRRFREPFETAAKAYRDTDENHFLSAILQTEV